MGVVRERKVVCESGKQVPSNPETAQNSGYTTQDEDEERTYEHRRGLQRQPLRTLTGLNLNFNLLITRHTGKRKVNRVLNTRFLETLREENEIDTLFESNKSKFQIIMEEMDDALEFLNTYDNNENEPEINVSKKCSCDNPYLNIPRKVRAAINSKKNFPYDLLKTIESNLISHFESHPGAVYFYYPESCYERMLVHAAAKFNGYFSETFVKDEKRAVKVTTGGSKNATPKLLCDYLEEIRKENRA